MSKEARIVRRWQSIAILLERDIEENGPSGEWHSAQVCSNEVKLPLAS